MKTQILLTTVAALLVTSLFGVGCAKKADDAPPVTAPADTLTVPPNPGADSRTVTPGMDYGYGATADFTPDSMTVMNTYAATHPLNAPKNFKINVNLSDIGSGHFAGVIQLSYFDNGSYYNGYFASGTGTAVNTYRYNGKSEAEFNQWFTQAADGKKVFHGFFQDQYGAIILVVDDSISSGDGGLPSEVSGTVWFKNFPTSYAQQSPAKCWFIEIGPYDCRTFIADNEVKTNLSLNPWSTDGSTNGYAKLGKFSGLNAKKAFNGQ